MPCYACGTPFEADAHWGDCWFAQLHGGFRHEAKQLLTQWVDKLTAQEQTINAQATQLAAVETENGALRARLREAEGRAWYEVDDG